MNTRGIKQHRRNCHVRNVTDSFKSMMRTYHQIVHASSNGEGKALWLELTKGITMFRRTISKLEAQAFDILSELDRSSPVVNKSKTMDRGDVIDAVTLSDDDDEDHFATFDRNDLTYKQEEQQEVVATMRSFSNSTARLEDVSSAVSSVVTSSSDVIVTSSSVSTASTVPQQDLLDDLLDKAFKPDEDLVVTPVLSSMTSSIRSVVNFDENEMTSCHVVNVISPLEFYVIKSSEIGVLYEIECLLNSCFSTLINQNLSPTGFSVGNCCLVMVNGRLYRAVIKDCGHHDVLVLLVDYGLSHWIDRDECFGMPEIVANKSPALAHFCTSAEADIRVVDQAVMADFHTKVTHSSTLFLRAHGISRKTHGELVEILKTSTGTRKGLPTQGNVLRIEKSEERIYPAEKQPSGEHVENHVK